MTRGKGRAQNRIGEDPTALSCRIGYCLEAVSSANPHFPINTYPDEWLKRAVAQRVHGDDDLLQSINPRTFVNGTPTKELQTKDLPFV